MEDGGSGEDREVSNLIDVQQCGATKEGGMWCFALSMYLLSRNTLALKECRLWRSSVVTP